VLEIDGSRPLMRSSPLVEALFQPFLQCTAFVGPSAGINAS